MKLSETNQNLEQDEITLKELLLKLQEYWNELLEKKILILVITVCMTLVVFMATSLKPTIYKGEITFMLNNEGKGNLGGVSGILGQFGFPSNQGSQNLSRILDLSRSRVISQLAIFDRVEVDGKEDFLANHLIREYDYHEKWRKSETLKDFLFVHDSTVLFNKVENTVFRQLYKLVSGAAGNGGLLSTSIDDNSGIMTISVETTSNDISFALVETTYNRLIEYYKQKTVEKQEKTYQLFKSKTDSIQNALTTAQFRLSKFQDSNRNLMLRQDEIERSRLELEIQKLLIAYGEAYKNLEIADFALKSQTPFIQLIDAPLYPLASISPSKKKAIMSGIFIGLVLSVIFILARKIIRDALSSEQE